MAIGKMKTAEEQNMPLFVFLSCGSVGALAAVACSACAVVYNWLGLIGGVGFAVAAAFAFYRLNSVEDVPKIQAAEALQSHIARCRSLCEPFQPPWWGAGLLQSLAFAMCARRNHRWLRDPRTPSYRGPERELLDLQDSGRVGLDWYVPPGPTDPAAPVLLFLHGVVGHARANYVQRAVEFHEHKRTGWRLVARTWRGMDIALASPQPEDWSRQAAKDTLAVLRHLRASFPAAPIFIMGQSIGACCVLHALPEAAGLVTAALSVSGPFSWVHGLQKLAAREHPIPFGAHNTRVLWSYFTQRHGGAKSAFETLEDDKKIPRQSLQKATEPSPDLFRPSQFLPGRKYTDVVDNFHARVTCPYAGHKTHVEYYRAVDQLTLRSMRTLQTPTLCMYAEDDPVTPYEISMLSDVVSNPMIASYVTKYGGHCGWFTKIFQSLVDDIAFEWFSSFLKEI